MPPLSDRPRATAGAGTPAAAPASLVPARAPALPTACLPPPCGMRRAARASPPSAPAPFPRPVTAARRRGTSAAGPSLAAATAVLALQLAPDAATAQPAEAKTLERVVVTGGRPSTLPLEIPTTTEGVTAETIRRSINAIDAEDALKYLPSLSVRKRYPGDHDHAVLASRASGSGNSARSLVYADGILLSNLLGNGAAYTPRWGLVTPEQIERVDVLYGPFSAAYPGNSAGAIVDFVTRMPTRLEAHVKAQATSQHYRLYGTDDRFRTRQGSASLGSASGPWSWWVDVNRLEADAQPIVFANRLVAQGSATTPGTPVSGAVADANPRNQPWLLFGAGQQTHSVQDHAKLKLALDLTPALRASYTLGVWRNDYARSAQTFLRDAAGNPVYAGPVSVGGQTYTLGATDLQPSTGRLEHWMHGFGIESRSRGEWDWKAAASVYDYREDRVRTPSTVLPGALAGGAGRIADMAGTGWNTLALKATWRPGGGGARGAAARTGSHVVEGGWQRDAFRLRSAVYDTPDWRGGEPGAVVSRFEGDTVLQSLWVQDAWRFAPRWRSVVGLRAEEWHAFNGSITGVALPTRRERHLSPKAALAFEAAPTLTLKASVGRAVRMPTVAELYQGTVTAGAVVNNDPDLKPERSWTGEWTAEWAPERQRGSATLRATLFAERTGDALYSLTTAVAGGSVTMVRNVDEIRTLGFELAGAARQVGFAGLDVDASLTYADSKIVRNDALPASVGHWQPRVPRWRATLLAVYAIDERWSASLGARYSGLQYGQPDGSDGNGRAYGGFSRCFAADARLRARLARQWSAAIGVDNLNDAVCWAFHPYPQRTAVAELRYDL